MYEFIILIGIAALLGAILGTLRNGFAEVVKGLESIDERLASGRK